MGKKKLNRETYLEVAKVEISTLFKSKGYPFKAKDLKGIKVTTSFPTSGGQSARAPIGLCCYNYNSNTEILISPVLGGKTIDESIEVLARIVTAEQGAVLLPERFICVAEDLDLINLITFQLFEKATGDFSEIKTRLGYKLKLAFNLSPCQLEDLSCPDKLALILHLNQLTPSEIILEITEQHALSSSAQLETLNRLRMRGFGISLDDFGTGFTNVQQLKTLPFTEVKIDRTLISNIESDLFSQVIVSSLVNIAIQDDLTIVAEGIERVEELEYLERFKEHILMQGFLISRPKGKTEFIRWAQSWLHMVSLNSHSRR